MSTNPTKTRHSSKQAAKIVHELRQARLDPAERAADQRLRIVAAVGVVAMLIGLFIGEQMSPPAKPWVMGASLAFGVIVFGVALFKASRLYKQSYRQFVVKHMADDGTFLFCPQCREPLGDPESEAVKQNPPAACSSCGTTPWKFERPA